MAVLKETSEALALTDTPDGFRFRSRENHIARETAYPDFPGSYHGELNK